MGFINNSELVNFQTTLWFDIFTFFILMNITRKPGRKVYDDWWKLLQLQEFSKPLTPMIRPALFKTDQQETEELNLISSLLFHDSWFHFF